MFTIREFRKEPDRLADFLPWAALVAPGVVLNKEGSFQTTYAYRGPDLESSTDSELIVISERINNALKRPGSSWSIFFEAQRRRPQGYPDSEFPCPVSSSIDHERRELFELEGEHYESTYYVTFVFLPPSDRVNRLIPLFIENTSKKSFNYSKCLSKFIDDVEGIVDIIRGAIPNIRRLSDDETLTYLHSAVSTKYHRVKSPDTPLYLDALLPDEPLTPGLEPKLGDSFLKIICLRSFPGESFPVLFDGLNNLHMPYRWTSRFICLDKESAVRELKKYKRQWYAKRKTLETLIKDVFSKDSDSESIMTDTDAHNKAGDSDQALQEVSDDRAAYGFYTFTVIVSDKDKAKAEEKIKAVESVINGLGFTTIREGVNAVEAWLGSLPGHVHANVRRPIISAQNLSHMIPLSAVWAGDEYNEHLKGPPLFSAVSTGNTPFRFIHHIGDVGHTLVVGPTGSGKSVLLSLMALQFLRYPDVQVYFFDKGASALAATAGVQGDFYDLCSDTGDLAFQPLAEIDTDAEVSWAFEWLIDLLILENVDITPGLKKELWSSLTSLATAPCQQRTITGLIALVQNRLLREALTPYSLKGPHRRLLDSAHDGLSYGRWQCFEMEEIMNTPRLVPPVLMYLFHRLEGRFKESHPSLLILDEAWLFLDNPFFSERIKEWLKVLRKKNVSVIFATQSLSDIVNSPLFTTVVESCPTRVFLPNSSALDETTKPLYQTFGLNQRQIEILAAAAPRRDYYYSSPKGSRLFQLGLGPCALSFCSASREDKREIRYLLSEKGKQGCVDEYVRVKDLNLIHDSHNNKDMKER